MGKRVLLLNPGKKDNFIVDRIHMGLSILGEILVSKKHTVKVIDYAFLKSLKNTVKPPQIEEVINEFKPDVIGISVFTYLYEECLDFIERISKCSCAPIILGGPHFAVFPKDFADNGKISYIVKGEAEKIILNLIENAKREKKPIFIDCPLPTAQDIPEINLDIAYGNEHMSIYQIQLSRGCPYNCSFCNIRFVAGKQIRSRNIETCLEHIIKAKKSHDKMKMVTITDDCPTFDKERFKTFLRLYKETAIGCNLCIDNVRANLIDEEMIRLYKEAGGQNICLGTESGHPEVFKLTTKGESIEDIIKAGRLVHKYDLKLGLCFVIGLPEDSLERNLHSVKLAKTLKPEYIFWNMVVPWPGTKIRQWYDQHGKVGELRNFSTLIDAKFNFKEPVCESECFSKNDMTKAWIRANLETESFLPKELFFLNIRKTWKLIFKYQLYKSVIYLLPKLTVLLLARVKRLLAKLVDKCKMIIKAALKQALGTTIGTRNQSTREIWLEDTLKQIPAGSRILDAGAGEQAYKRFCKHLNYVAQDFAKYDGKGDASGLQMGKWDQTNLNIICDITNIPEPDASFDAVMCVEVFEHLPEPIKAIQEFSRLLKPGGHLILTAPFCSLTHFAPYHFYTGYNRYFYDTHLPAHGFKIVELRKNGNYFEYIAQEIRRIPEMTKRYAGNNPNFFETIVMKLCLIMLNSSSKKDTGSNEMLNFGFHIFAVKTK